MSLSPGVAGPQETTPDWDASAAFERLRSEADQAAQAQDAREEARFRRAQTDQNPDLSASPEEAESAEVPSGSASPEAEPTGASAPQPDESTGDEAATSVAKAEFEPAFLCTCIACGAAKNSFALVHGDSSAMFDEVCEAKSIEKKRADDIKVLNDSLLAITLT